MKKALLFWAFCLMISFTHAEKKFTIVDKTSTANSISPNGKYVVGNDPTMVPYGTMDAVGGFRSYLLDTGTGTVEWMTDSDFADYNETGYFTDVNDEKTIVGYFKDPGYVITVVDFGETNTLPINVAAIWKNGSKSSLGIGDFTLDDFDNFADGSFATAVSGDNKLVVGFVAQGNFATTTPCAWKYNEVIGKWDFMRYKLPISSKGGQIFSVSTDGSVAVGSVELDGRSVAAYWNAAGECTTIQGTKTSEADDTQYNTEGNYGKAIKVSSNGLYIAFQFNTQMPALYLTQEKKYIKIGTYEDANGLEVASVSDNGDVVGIYRYGNFFVGTYTRPFWYSLKARKKVGLDYFVSLYASGLDIPYTFTFEARENTYPKSISADGKIIIGNNGDEGWVLQGDDTGIDIPESVKNVKVESFALKEVTVTWDKVESTDKLLLLSYNIYCDGNLLANVADSKSNYIHKGAVSGYPKYSVAALYKVKEGGRRIESPRDEIVEVCVPDTYALPLFDDFESGATATNYWSKMNYTTNSQAINWGCPMYLGINSSCCLNTGVTLDEEEYSSALVSRPLNAIGQTKVYVSYAVRYLFFNHNDWVKTSDFLAIEISTDNQNWTPVKIHRVDNDSRRDKWEFESIDISELVANKLFRVRIREYGKGLAQINWNLDIFKVGTEVEKAAPEDLTGEVKKNEVNLIWKNSFGAYDLNYLRNPLGENVFELAIGDENKPFIAVNAFEAADLSLYKDKYITSVTTFVNHDFNIENSKDTHISIVLYEDNVLTREQEIINPVYNEDNIVVLDNPVKIDGTKEIKFGVKIFNYDERQLPISYQNAMKFVPGKSDLYSQDNGRTWKKLSDFFATVKDHELDGYCCWNITANVTDEPIVNRTLIKDNNLLAYNVFRNGEKMNLQSIYHSQPRFTDENPVDNGCYKVVAYYLDGTISDASAQYCIGSLTSVRESASDLQIGIYPNPATDYINISGDFDSITLTDINGRYLKKTSDNVLSLVGLSSGIYIVQIEKGERVETKKLVVKR